MMRSGLPRQSCFAAAGICEGVEQQQNSRAAAASRQNQQERTTEGGKQQQAAGTSLSAETPRRQQQPDHAASKQAAPAAHEHVTSRASKNTETAVKRMEQRAAQDSQKHGARPHRQARRCQARPRGGGGWGGGGPPPPTKYNSPAKPAVRGRGDLPSDERELQRESARGRSEPRPVRGHGALGGAASGGLSYHDPPGRLSEGAPVRARRHGDVDFEGPLGAALGWPSLGATADRGGVRSPQRAHGAASSRRVFQFCGYSLLFDWRRAQVSFVTLGVETDVQPVSAKGAEAWLALARVVSITTGRAHGFADPPSWSSMSTELGLPVCP